MRSCATHIRMVTPDQALATMRFVTDPLVPPWQFISALGASLIGLSAGMWMRRESAFAARKPCRSRMEWDQHRWLLFVTGNGITWVRDGSLEPAAALAQWRWHANGTGSFRSFLQAKACGGHWIFGPGSFVPSGPLGDLALRLHSQFQSFATQDWGIEPGGWCGNLSQHGSVQTSDNWGH